MNSKALKNKIVLLNAALEALQVLRIFFYFFSNIRILKVKRRFCCYKIKKNIFGFEKFYGQSRS